MLYNIPAFQGTLGFLLEVAKAKGRLRKVSIAFTLSCALFLTSLLSSTGRGSRRRRYRSLNPS